MSGSGSSSSSGGGGGRKRKLMTLEKSNNKNSSYTSQFLIDGKSPIEPHPDILELKSETNSHHGGAGRHRSVDLKGLILELIDDIYPPLICPACFHTSDIRADAEQHLKDRHHGQKLFSCVSFPCEQAYSSKAGLRYHLEHNHEITSDSVNTNLPNKKQENNRKKPAIRSTLNNSIQEKKEKQKKPELSEDLGNQLNDLYPLNVCPACKKDFKRKTHVVNHLVEEHHGQEPYKCIVQDCKRTKAYASREGLVYHLINYHDQ